MLTNIETQEVLLADGSTQANDFTWAVEEDASVAENTIVSVANLAKLGDVSGKKGVLLTVDDDAETLINDNALPLAELDIIAINFANFNDGRGYSYASLLRRVGYKGELRAVGDVFKDTLYYMKRCGFNSYVLKEEKSLDEAKDGLTTFTQGYQATEAQPEGHYQVGAN